MILENKTCYDSMRSTPNKKFYEEFLLFCIFLLFVAVPSCKKETSCESCREHNKPPLAIAGLDQIITLPTDSISLDGSASSDPDGTISEWLWTKISGPASFNIVKPKDSTTFLKNLTTGTYQFELKITDNGGLFSKDTVQVILNDPAQPNRPPIANAGSDQAITLPVNTVTLDGSASTDPDHNITSYQWTKISGPSSFNITNANAVQTQIANLVEGIYHFELKVTDAGGLYRVDTVQVRVVNQSPPPPCTDCKIVFVSSRDGNAEIYSCNVDGSNIRRLTNNAGTDDQPAWSPDGTRIAFISDRTGQYELYTMNADGSDVVRRTFSGNQGYHPAWSPDGTKIVYSTPGNGSLDIWVVGATNGSPSLLFGAPGWDGEPAWSPDGTKIALVSDWMAYDLVYDIYTINADGTGFTALSGNIFDSFDYLNPSWSPGGTKIAMAIRQTTAIDHYNTQIGIMNTDGSGITIIRSGASPWTTTSWSGNGTLIVYTSQSGSGMDVSWVSADGSAWGTIVANGWNANWKH